MCCLAARSTGTTRSVRAMMLHTRELTAAFLAELSARVHTLHSCKLSGAPRTHTGASISVGCSLCKVVHRRNICGIGNGNLMMQWDRTHRDMGETVIYFVRTTYMTVVRNK